MSVTSIISTAAHSLLENDSNAILVDVRTLVEWREVGVPDVNDDTVIFLTWSTNILDFEKQILLKISNKMHNVFFLCRSGVRSLAAANFIFSRGYKNCYNIIDGFEGNTKDKGWKQNNLPWRISSDY